MQLPALSVGTVLALVVLVLVVVLWAVGHITPLLAGLIGALALARLC